MIKRFFKDSLSYGFASFLSRSVSLVLVPIYSRILNPHDYGIMDMIMVFSALAIVIVPFEINQGVSRFLPECSDEKDTNLFVSTSFWFTLSASGLFIVLATVFSGHLSEMFLDSPSLKNMFIIGMCAIFCRIFFNFSQNILRFRLRPKIYVLSSCIFTISSAILTLVLLVVYRIGVVSIFWGQIFGYITAFSVSFCFSKIRLNSGFDAKKLRELLFFSFPLLFSSIFILIAQYVDRFMIKMMIDIDSVGYYGIAFRIASITSVILIGLQNSLTPLIYSNYKNSETPGNISKIFNYFLLFSILIFVFFSGFSFELIKYFTSTKYVDSIPVLPFMIISLLVSNMYIFTPGLFLEKKTKTIALINIVVVTENLLLNFVFISLLGITGAAIATGLSSLTGFILYYFLGQKYYRVAFDWRKTWGALILGLLTVNVLISLPLNDMKFILLKFALASAVFLFTALLIDRKIMQFLNFVKKPAVNRQ